MILRRQAALGHSTCPVILDLFQSSYGRQRPWPVTSTRVTNIRCFQSRNVPRTPPHTPRKEDINNCSTGAVRRHSCFMHHFTSSAFGAVTDRVSLEDLVDLARHESDDAPPTRTCWIGRYPRLVGMSKPLLWEQWQAGEFKRQDTCQIALRMGTTSRQVHLRHALPETHRQFLRSCGEPSLPHCSAHEQRTYILCQAARRLNYLFFVYGIAEGLLLVCEDPAAEDPHQVLLSRPGAATFRLILICIAMVKFVRDLTSVWSRSSQVMCDSVVFKSRSC